MSERRTSRAWIWIVAGVGVVVLVGACAVAGFIGMILAYATTHAPPHGSAAPTTPSGDSVSVDFVDPQSGLSWTAHVEQQMEWDDARLGCAALGQGWRLPTRAELEAMRAVPPGQADLSPLREPLLSRNRAPFLWSGDQVTGRPGHAYVMNTSNGHVFNGHGRRAHARCVRR
jgi:hypothetical protein